MKRTRMELKDCKCGAGRPKLEVCRKYCKKYYSHIAITVLLCLFPIPVSFYTSSIFANPTGGKVTSGNATIRNSSPNHVQINQTSNKTIINWQSFNIGQQQTTHFQQPTGGIALNRINPTQGVSAIYGRLTATGQIILMNPAGIYFSSSAYVNVGGLIATTGNMSDQNFLNGNYHFSYVSPYSGSVINQGTIIAADHGLVALMGNSVQNDGFIQANFGHVILASGNAFTMTFTGNELISFSIDERSASGKGIRNTGTLRADGGQILVTAKTVSGILDNIINMEGVAQARSVGMQNGEIILYADKDAGVIHVAGTLDVSGKKLGEMGGKVKVTGAKILIDYPTIIDASGDLGGGEVLIGGDYQGKGPLSNTLNTTINEGVLIKANTLRNGHGGKVIVWSNVLTNYAGHISATGGRNSGDGGFAEVSGHQLLNFQGTVDLSAAKGSTGTLLLDPENLTIQSAGPTTATNSGGNYTSNVDNSILTVADLQTALANANVLVQTGTGGLQAGDITVSNNVSWANANALTLSAFRNINMNATITNSSGGNLTLQSDNTGTGLGTITFSGITPQINMGGGGTVNFYYNPASFPIPTNFSSNVNVSGGTTFIPYMLVNNLTNLQNMNNSLSGNYALGRIINASETSGWNSGAGFVPIGSSASNFTGKFDGQNHTIDNLTIFLPISDAVGLFGYVNTSGSIQNVGLTNMTVTGLTNVGGLIGFDAAGTVNNAYSTGSVTSDAISTNIGGLIGFSGSNVSNSYSTATVLAGATSNYVGGLIGRAGASISNSYHATGSVTAGATSNYVGGLVGHNLGSVSHAYNTGPVIIGATGSTNFGGLIGYSVGNVYYSYNTGTVDAGAAVTNVGGLVGYGFGTINNSYSTGAIVTGATGSSNIGGLVGFAGNDISNSYSTSSISGGAANNNVGGLVGQNNAIISNSYSTGNVAAGAGSTFLGGLVGLNNTTVNNSFWDIQTSGQLASAGGVGKTTAEMMQQTTFCPSGNCSGDLTHFDFANTWGIVNGVTYPSLRPAMLTYTANAGSMIYGDTVPSLFGTITGFVGSETLATATMGTLAFSSLVTSTSNVGSYAVTGSGLTANNGNYLFIQAPSNATAFSVTQAPLTLTATDRSKTYGDTLALGTSAFTSAGLRNSETVGSVTLTSSGAGALANVSSSPYAITPTDATGGTFTASNYSISYINGVLTVIPATLTYNANTNTMTYGSSVPALSGTVTGFVNSQTQANATTGTLGFNSSATSTSNVGSYAVTGSGLTANNGNYLFIQAPSNATAFSVTQVSPSTPHAKVVALTPTAASNTSTLSSSLTLVPNILNIGTHRNTFKYQMNAIPDITILNNTASIANNTGLIKAGITSKNATGGLSNNFITSKAQKRIIPSLSPKHSVMQNEVSQRTWRNQIIERESPVLLSSYVLAMLLVLLLAMLLIIGRRKDVARNSIIFTHDYYHGTMTTNAIDVGDLLSGILPSSYTITTNFIFTGTKWVTISWYSNFSPVRPCKNPDQKPSLHLLNSLEYPQRPWTSLGMRNLRLKQVVNA